MTGSAGDQPQWLGSLARRGEEAAAADAEPAFDEGAAQWLGSVARRDDGAPDQTGPSPSAGWTGSSERSALFAASKPDAGPSPVAAPVASATVHELAARERVVMGALGMTLRVAA